MKKNENGFSIIGIVVIIVVIGLIGAVGYILFNKQQETTDNHAKQGSLKTYSNSVTGLSLKYSEEYKLDANDNRNDKGYVLAVDISKDSDAETAKQKKDGLKLSIAIDDILTNPLAYQKMALGSDEKILGTVPINGKIYTIMGDLNEDKVVIKAHLQECDENNLCGAIKIKDKYMFLAQVIVATETHYLLPLDTNSQEYNDMLTILKSMSFRD